MYRVLVVHIQIWRALQNKLSRLNLDSFKRYKNLRKLKVSFIIITTVFTKYTALLTSFTFSL